MMHGHQNSQRKALRSAFNEHRQPGFGVTPPTSQKQKDHLRQSTSPDLDGDIHPSYQMVRPFESQNKEVYGAGGYENYEPFKMPQGYKSQTPQRSRMMMPSGSDEEHQEMIIPKDFSN